MILRRHRTISPGRAVVIGLLVGVGAMAGCSSAPDTSGRDMVIAPVPAPLAQPTARPTGPSTTAGRGSPAPSLPLVPPSGLAAPPAESSGPTTSTDSVSDPAVVEVQRRLQALGYYAGPVDGLLGPASTTALQAFQKVQGLPVDGRADPDTLQALADPVGPADVPGEPDRIIIDLDRQVLSVHLAGRLVRVMPVSSGNGEEYDLPGGVQARALTPAGSFRILRRTRGVVDAHFGRLTDPMWFHSGWAIHGSGNVPPTPASHGCVRLPRHDAEWLFDVAEVGMQVLVHGDRNAFRPALGETAGTDTPAGDPVPDPPPTAPSGAGFS